MSGLRALCCSKGDRADTQDTQATRPAQPRLAKTTQDVPPTIKQVPSTVVVPEKEEGHEKQQEQDKEEQDHEQEEGKEKEKLETPASRDLWKEAFDSLDPVGQSYLAGSDVPANVAIDRVIQDTTAKYKEWKTGGLKIRRKSGDDINIRDSAERIIGAAQKANGAISTIVSFDPTGHGKWSSLIV